MINPTIKAMLYSKKLILLILFQLLSCYNLAHAQNCILASDFGLGGTITVNSNPDQDSSLTQTTQTNPLNTNQTVNTALLQYFPQTHQIAPWISTGLVTSGIASNAQGTNSQYSILKGYINEGQWYPWGFPSTTDCAFVPCSQNIPSNQMCLQGGKIVYVDGSVSSPNNYPCVLSNGQGLYGLIAIENNGQYLDPNSLDNALTLPGAYFRTFYAEATTQDNEGHMVFQIPYTQLCDVSPSGETSCVIDTTPQGDNYVVKGQLYFQILDNYYADNSGSYTITVTSGVFSEQIGFIQSAITIFQNAMQQISTYMYIAITQDMEFINFTRAMLTLYVAFIGFGFLTGTLKMQQKEIIVRLIKVGLVATVISDSSWNFFNNNLFSLFNAGLNSMSQIIVDATLYYNNNPNDPVFLMPANGSPLSIFDNFLNMLVSQQVNFKILSTLFFNWEFYYIPAIYTCWIMLMMGIFRAIFLYVLAIFQFTLLISSGPIFIVMILFEMTKSLFDEWVKMMLNSVFLLLLVVSTFALMMSIILDQLETLLYYEVCWQTVWSPSIIGITLFDLPFWYPAYASQINGALTLANFFALLVVCLVFTGFLEQVPQVADSLVASQRPMAAASVASATRGLEGSIVGKAMAVAKGLNPIGMAMNKLESVPLVGGVAKKVGGVLQNPNKITGLMDRIYKGQDGDQTVKNFLPTQEISGKFKEGFDKHSQ